MLKQGIALAISALVLSGCGGSDDNSEIKILHFSSSMVICEDIETRLCFAFTEDENSTDFAPFYGYVEAMAFKWGLATTVKVLKYEKDNAPADSSQYGYKLLGYESASEDAVGTDYSYTNVDLWENTFTLTDGEYYFYHMPFTCAENVDCDALVPMSGSGGQLAEVTFSYLGHGNIQLDHWM